jgi:hypothetical protein
MRDVTGDFRAVPNGLFQKRIARIARNCPFRHHYLFFFYQEFRRGGGLLMLNDTIEGPRALALSQGASLKQE